MPEKITLEISDDHAATVRDLNGGAWSDDADFWADVIDWGLSALVAMKENADSEKLQGPPLVVKSPPDGEMPF